MFVNALRRIFRLDFLHGLWTGCGPTWAQHQEVGGKSRGRVGGSQTARSLPVGECAPNKDVKKAKRKQGVRPD